MIFNQSDFDLRRVTKIITIENTLSNETDSGFDIIINEMKQSQSNLYKMNLTTACSNPYCRDVFKEIKNCNSCIKKFCECCILNCDKCGVNICKFCSKIDYSLNKDFIICPTC